MKKPLLLILVAILAVTSIVGVTAATARMDKTSTIKPTSVITTKTSVVKKNNELTLPEITGTWVNENNSHCTVQVYNQDGNTIDFMIESTNESYTKIATANVSVTLELRHDGAVVRGTSDFDYTDSFGNSGKGRISASENVITIALDKATDVNGWGIGNASGDYIFKSKDVSKTPSSKDDTTNCELTLPDVTGTWVNENNSHCTVAVYNQDGNTIDFMIESSNESYSKIATANVSATLELRHDGAVVRGSSDFDYTDSFGNTGEGRITASENVITIALDKATNVNVWGINNASGDYIFKSNSVDMSQSYVNEDTSESELVLPDVTGTWKHEDAPNNCNVQVYNQDGNTIDFMIEYSNDSNTKISTAKVSVTLDLWYDGAVVRGSSDFTFTDSFGNTGKGSISVSENVILITFDEVDNTGMWSVSAAGGKYIFASESVYPYL